MPTRGTYAGRGVHLAARVAALAGPGEILVTFSTADAAGAHLQQRRLAALKGIAEAR